MTFLIIDPPPNPYGDKQEWRDFLERMKAARPISKQTIKLMAKALEILEE